MVSVRRVDEGFISVGIRHITGIGRAIFEANRFIGRPILARFLRRIGEREV